MLEWCLVPHISFCLIGGKKPVLKKNRTCGPAMHSRYTPKISDSPEPDEDLKLGNYTSTLIWHLFPFISTAFISDSIKRSNFFQDPPSVICFPDSESGEYIQYHKIFQVYPTFRALC
jgi:hypothetical protein